MRFIYLISGFSTLIFAVLGVFLPLLPTTPFLLLSAFCFARSSEKLHIWLLEHPYLGQNIQNWQENGSISRKAKVTSMAMILLTIVLSVVLQIHGSLLLIQIVVLSCVSLFILTRPNC